MLSLAPFMGRLPISFSYSYYHNSGGKKSWIQGGRDPRGHIWSGVLGGLGVEKLAIIEAISGESLKAVEVLSYVRVFKKLFNLSISFEEISINFTPT